MPKQKLPQHLLTLMRNTGCEILSHGIGAESGRVETTLKLGDVTTTVPFEPRKIPSQKQLMSLLNFKCD